MAGIEHVFKAYADSLGLCAAELPDNGETCNRTESEHTSWGAIPKPDDIWADDPEHPVADWQAEVANDDTRLGYWQWVEAQREWKGAIRDE